ncbi:hypothetical protein [Metallosphaera hakonensis]|uniref:hypothetical protein n=2 Tax=Metallosphaera hakonensis TaxID=79601 RepID=UPI001F116693|nr:hypothetical protein [Metallosphaera hakonensis]
MIIKEELKVRVKYNIKINSKGERVKYPYYVITFPIEYSNMLKERKMLKSVIIVTDEEKIELNNAKMFSLEYYKREEEKIPYFSTVGRLRSPLRFQFISIELDSRN